MDMFRYWLGRQLIYLGLCAMPRGRSGTDLAAASYRLMQTVKGDA